MKKYGILIIILLAACRTPQQQWLDSLAGYKETKSKTMTLQIMKMTDKKDTTVLNYQVRLYPAKDWLENSPPDATNNLNYRMDSCFTLKAGGRKQNPVFVQPVAGGVKNCFEYLVSFTMDNTVKMKTLQLVYTDRYIDGRTYFFDLNQR